jgi:hypothetical protein
MAEAFQHKNGLRKAQKSSGGDSERKEPPPHSRAAGSHINRHTKMTLIREKRKLEEQPRTLGTQPHSTNPADQNQSKLW